jgi:hypothetical protein
VTLVDAADGERARAETSEICPRLGGLVAELFSPTPA